MTSLLAALVLSLTYGQPELVQRPGGDSPAAVVRIPSKVHRWIDWQSAPLETRYRYVETSAGATALNQWQHKESVKGALKFDAAGRFTLQAFLGTGNGFGGSWDATGVGTGDPTWDFRVRRLFVQAIPVEGVELAAGSFDVLRGEATEIVSYDNDAFMEGYRVSIRRPAALFFTDVSVTAGYLGDLTTPNVFRRFNRMGDHNYTQVLLDRKVAALLNVTFDWTSVSGVSTLREAVRLTTRQWGHVADAVRVELYQRVDDPDGAGVAFTAERALSRRVSVTGGVADVDADNPPLNGDRYLRGTRFFGGTSIALLPELTLAAFYTHAYGNDFAVANDQRFDAILSFNVLKALQRRGAW